MRVRPRTLTGSFEGNGEVTHYYFEWGPTTEYGMTSATPPGPSAGSPTYPPLTQLTYSATGLESETVYHFRVVAENGIGITHGQDETFETPPAVQSLTTEGAEAAPGTGTLHASYLGDGNGTSYYFEYVKFSKYDQFAMDPYGAGQTTAAPPGADGGSGTGAQELSAAANGLEPYVEYHYRVVATNTFGTTYGADQTFFSAPPNLPAVNSTSSSNISQVAATLNAQINAWVRADDSPLRLRVEHRVRVAHLSDRPDRVRQHRPFDQLRNRGTQPRNDLPLPCRGDELRGNGQGPGPELHHRQFGCRRATGGRAPSGAAGNDLRTFVVQDELWAIWAQGGKVGTHRQRTAPQGEARLGPPPGPPPAWSGQARRSQGKEPA